MDAKRPATPAATQGNPIQDNVTDPTVQRPTVQTSTGNNAGADAPGPDATVATRPSGPNTSAVVVGLVAMVFAGLTIAKETMGLRIDWSRLGPGAIVGIGVVMVVLGAIGLVRRHDRG
jgi:hypothetical protein